MALHRRRATDHPQTTAPPEPEPEPGPECEEPEPASTTSMPGQPQPEPEPGPEPPAADVHMAALGTWDGEGSLHTATFSVTRLALGYAHVDDAEHRLVPGTKVLLLLELPDGPYAMLGQARAVAADTSTVTVTSAERGDSRLRRFLTDRAS